MPAFVNQVLLGATVCAERDDPLAPDIWRGESRGRADGAVVPE